MNTIAWLGYLSGVIRGFTFRNDIPDDVRDLCKRISTDFDIWIQDRNNPKDLPQAEKGE